MSDLICLLSNELNRKVGILLEFLLSNIQNKIKLIIVIACAIHS